MLEGAIILGVVSKPPLDEDEGLAVLAAWLSQEPKLVYRGLEVRHRAPRALSQLAANALPIESNDAWKEAGRSMITLEVPKEYSIQHPSTRRASRWYAQLPGLSSTLWGAVQEARAETGEVVTAIPRSLDNLTDFETTLSIIAPQVRSSKGRIQTTEYFHDELRTVLGDIRANYQQGSDVLAPVERLRMFFPLRLNEGEQLSNAVGALFKGNKKPIEAFLERYERRTAQL